MEVAVAYNDKEIETLGVAKSQNFGFSKDAEEMIFTMFTKNIYSNPIGSVVREITSNCFDSHKEANITDPVIVKLTKENNEFYISFIDVGVGMSPERITKVYAQYFNSTKRNDNNQIGGFGIGGKTPLAYAESFFLITIFDGVKYTYSIRKGKSSPVLDLLTKKKTIERNGTTIKIPVRANDVYVFEREILRQLYYFENVIFEGFSGTVKNDYRIIEGKNFFYRGKDQNQYAHICLGRVAYPIDFSVLEDDSQNFYQGNWNVPVAIKMAIGEINVTVSREAIDYTETTKKLIKKKLMAVKAEMLDLLEKQHAKLDSLEDYYRMENDPATLFLSKEDSINIASFTQHRITKFSKLDALRIPSQSEVVHKFYDVSLFGKTKRRTHTWDRSVRTIGNEHVYMIGDAEDMPRKKNAYMKNTFGHFYSIKRTIFSKGELRDLIKSVTPDKSLADTRVIFKQFRELQKEVYKLVESKVKRYSTVVVPDGFKIATGNKYNPNYELPVTFNSKYGFTKERVKMAQLGDSKATLFYGDLEAETLMGTYVHQYEALFQPKDEKKFRIANSDYQGYPIRFIMVSKSNLRYITELKNAKPMIEFEKVLIRKRDAVIKQIEKEMFMARYNQQSELFLNENLFKFIDKTYAKKVSSLKNLFEKYHAVKSYRVDIGQGSTLIQFLKIDRSQINYKGHDLFAGVEKATDKNGMLSFIKINKNFDPTDKDSHYGQKEINNIMKLLKLAYVQ